MEQMPIFTSEPQATRALGAEIRHDHRRFVELLERVSGRSFGEFLAVECEANARMDVLLHFTDTTVGIEAKFDHAISQNQLKNETKAVGDSGKLFLLVTKRELVPGWLAERFSDVSVITWDEALRCFEGSRITLDDIRLRRTPKSQVESRFEELGLAYRFGDHHPDWEVLVKRGGSGIPGVVITSPTLPDSRQLVGHIEVNGRKMPAELDDLRFYGFCGVTADKEEDYFDPDTTDRVPGWVTHLRLLNDEVLRGREFEYLISTRPGGAGHGEFGKWKMPLAKKHLPELLHLAKGYTDGWGLGVTTARVDRDGLEGLADRMLDIFTRWYDAEWANQPAETAAESKPAS